MTWSIQLKMKSLWDDFIEREVNVMIAATLGTILKFVDNKRKGMKMNSPKCIVGKLLDLTKWARSQSSTATLCQELLRCSMN